MQGQAMPLGERLASARDRAARAQAAIEQARAEAERRRAVLVEVDAARHSAQETARAAEDDLRHLEQAHASHMLRGALAVGQPCPVCATKVRKVPALEPVDDLEHARQSRDEARRRLTEAQGHGQRATADVAAADDGPARLDLGVTGDPLRAGPSRRRTPRLPTAGPSRGRALGRYPTDPAGGRRLEPGGIRAGGRRGATPSGRPRRRDRRDRG